MDDGAGGLPSLADTIAAVRCELSAALAAGLGRPAWFRAGVVELDFEIAVTCTGGGQAGVHLSVLTLGGKSALAHATTQRIKVTLEPLDPGTGSDAQAASLASGVSSSAGGALPERRVRAEVLEVQEVADGLMIYQAEPECVQHPNNTAAISEQLAEVPGPHGLPSARRRQPVKLSEGTSVILFRFHDNPGLARERIAILRYFNPEMAIHALFCGNPDAFAEAQAAIHGLAETTWRYPAARSRDWMWLHGDLVVKAWYRSVGTKLAFDFIYVHEYDLLFTAPLPQIYPDIDGCTVALTGCAPLTPEFERRWQWTARTNDRLRFLAFCRYLQTHFGLERRPAVCFGPAPLLPRTFLDAWCPTQDIDLVHEEICYPAYAAALGFATINNGIHPGMGQSPPRFFDCNPLPVTMEQVIHEATRPGGRRAFHPVKTLVTLAHLLDHPVP